MGHNIVALNGFAEGTLQIHQSDREVIYALSGCLSENLSKAINLLNLLAADLNDFAFLTSFAHTI